MKLLYVPYFFLFLFASLMIAFPSNYIYLGAFAISAVLVFSSQKYKHAEITDIEKRVDLVLKELTEKVDNRLKRNEDDLGKKIVEINDKFGALSLGRNMLRKNE